MTWKQQHHSFLFLADAASFFNIERQYLLTLFTVSQDNQQTMAMTLSSFPLIQTQTNNLIKLQI